MFGFSSFFKNKKAMEISMIGWIIIILVVFAIAVVAFIYANKSNLSAGEFLKNLFRLRDIA